jgi:hypothetical protein
VQRLAQLSFCLQPIVNVVSICPVARLAISSSLTSLVSLSAPLRADPARCQALCPYFFFPLPRDFSSSRNVPSNTKSSSF